VSTLHGRANNAIPERIGKYEIRQELGKGGFGQVFLGFDPTVGRQVAIKVLASDGDPNSLRRFRHEASAAGNLHHKNIVTIHEFGEDGGTFYIAMEYLEGRDLQHIIAAPNTLSILDKIRIMSEAAEGLQCAHLNGIVHRDVKPANIMVLQDGSVKLMDFGIARLTRDHSTRLTETGFLIGSVFYMAPEQLNGREIDARCDVWAFGTIYYELLCGRHPFEAPDIASAIVRIMQYEPKPIESVCPECPSELAAVVARLLSKDREARYQNFEEVLFDTAPILLAIKSRQTQQFANQASDLVRKGDLDTAQSLVKKILLHDPAHEQGRALWQQLQSEFRHRSIRLRSQSLIEQADAAAAAHDYAAAIEALESAVRVDPANTALPARLAELRAAKQRSDLASHLVSSARENLHVDNLSTAFQLLGDALAAEPGHSEAQRLLSDVQVKISERDAQKRLREGLAKANGLMALQSFDEAIATLEALSVEAPGSEQVRAALDVAHRERDEYNRKRHIQSEVEAAKNEIKSSQFEAAIARLEPLANQSPGQSDIASLLTYARSELAAAKHMAKIRAAAEGAWKLLKAQEFDKALSEADAALIAFPDDPALLRLRQAIIKERAEREQARFVQQVLAESAELENKERLEQAGAALEKGLQRYPSESSLATALARVRQKLVQLRERAEREQAQFVQQVLAESAELERSDRLEQAGASLEKALQRYSAEPSLSAALARVRQKLVLKERAKQEQAQFIQQVLAEAAGLERMGRLEDACATLEKALQRHPSESSLADAQARMRQKLAAKQEQERAQREQAQFVQQALAESAEWERKGRLDEACATLDKALQRYPSEFSLADAQTRTRQKLIARQEQERAEREKAQFLQGVLAESAEWERKGRPEEACAALDKALQRYPSESSLADAQARMRQKLTAKQEQERAEREKAQFVQKALAESAEWERKGRFEGACATLEKALQRYPAEPSLAEALARTRQKLAAAQEQERAHREQSQFVQGALADSAELERKGRLEEACATLEKAAQRYPSESSLKDALARTRQKLTARQEQERAQREQAQFVQGALAASAEWERKGRLEEAGAALEKALLRYPSEPSLKDALARTRQKLTARQEQERAQREQAQFVQQALAESAGLESKGRLEQACAPLEKALQRYPSDSSLADALARTRQKLAAQQEQERAAALEKGLRQADTFIMQGQASQATQILAQMKVAYPGENRVFSLLDRAQAEERRRADLEKLRAEAQGLLDTNQPEQAYELLARGRKEFGADPKFIALETSAKKMLARNSGLARARLAFQQRNWPAAATALEAILQEEPNDPECRHLLDQVLDQERTELRRNRIETGRADAEKLIRGLQLQEAARRLRALCEEFPEEQSLRDDLARALDAIERQSRREAYTQGRNRAEAYLRSGQFQPAISSLEELAAQFPEDPILKEELKAAREARLEHDRRERYASGRRKAAELTQARKLRDAITILEALLADFPGDSVLQEDLKSARGALELQEQREQLDREVALLEKLYRKGDARGIKERASALPPNVQDARVRELLLWATTELERPRQDSQRQSAESLRHKRKQRIILAAVIACGVLAAIPIAMVLRPGPSPETLTTDHGQLNFALEGGAAPSSQTLHIGGSAAGGHGGVHWSATVSEDWLSVSPNRGVTQGQTTVSVDPRQLTPGPHSAYILLTSEDGATSVKTSVKVVVPPSGSGAAAAASQIETKPQEHTEEASKKPGGVAAPSTNRSDPKAGSTTPSTHSPSSVDSTAEKQPAHSAPQALPPVTDCGRSYNLARSGSLRWHSSGALLEKGAVLVIGGTDENLIGGQKLGAALPGCEVALRPLTEGIVIDEEPSRADGFKRVKLRNSSSAPISQIEVRWKIK
jgi:serine/threonine-protein kinase